DQRLVPARVRFFVKWSGEAARGRTDIGGGDMQGDGRRRFLNRVAALLALVPLTLAAGAARARTTHRHETKSSDDDRLKAMETQMQQMASELGVLQDQQAIRRLQHAYGYYFDKCLYDEVVELFTEDPEVHFGAGVYRGKAGARRLY